MKIEVRPAHEIALTRIKELWEESSGDLASSQLNRFYKSKNGGLELRLDYGMPVMLCTPAGSYEMWGIIGNKDKFWELLNEAFNVEVIRPARDEAELRSRMRSGDIQARFTYEYGDTGPYVKIMPRTPIL